MSLHFSCYFSIEFVVSLQIQLIFVFQHLVSAKSFSFFFNFFIVFFFLVFLRLAELQQRSPPSLISLAGGAPNPNTFPFRSATIELKSGENVTFNEATMKRALQYSASNG